MKQKTKKGVGQQIVESLQEFVEALESGVDIKKTFRCYRVEANPAAECDPKTVKVTRRMLGANQAAFARFLGVSLQTVRAWELGDDVPSNIAKRFLDEIRHDPEYWRARFRQVVAPKRRAVAS